MGIKVPEKERKIVMACSMLAAVLLVLPTLVIAGSQAQIKVEQAKVKFSDHKYKEALRLLDEAVGEEPDNGEAYHYAGLCQMALDKPAAAVALLSEAARLSPDDAGVHEDLAQAALMTKSYSQALSAADRALSLKPESPRALLLKGQAMIGLQSFNEALDLFKNLSQKQGYEQAGLYYAGICLAHMGLTQDAVGYFDQASQAGPDTELGIKAKEFAAALRGEKVERKKKVKPWSARVRVLYQYDHNIIPVHSEDFLPEDVTHKDDGREVVDVDLRYHFLDATDYRATIRYFGYSSWHEREHEYNLMYHMGELAGRYDLAGPYKTRLGAKFDYSSATLDNDPYSVYWKAIPEVSVTWSPMHKTRVVVDYMEENFDEDFNGKDAMDKDNSQVHAALYHHLLLMDGDINLWAGYQWGEVNADGDNYDRRDSAGIGGAMASLPGNAVLSCMVRYQDRDYPDNAFDRRERRTSVSGSFQMPIYKWINIYTSAVYMTTDGNTKLLDYERWIYTVGLMGSF